MSIFSMGSFHKNVNFLILYMYLDFLMKQLMIRVIPSEGIMWGLPEVMSIPLVSVLDQCFGLTDSH